MRACGVDGVRVFVGSLFVCLFVLCVCNFDGLFVVCCLLFARCCLLLCVRRCLLFVDCMFVVWRMLFALLFVVRCLLC